MYKGSPYFGMHAFINYTGACNWLLYNGCCILYSAKLWRWKSLRNLMNGERFIKVFPPNLFLLIFSYESYNRFIKVLLVKGFDMLNSPNFFTVKALRYICTYSVPLRIPLMYLLSVRLVHSDKVKSSLSLSLLPSYAFNFTYYSFQNFP